CMLMMFAWNFIANLNNGLWNYHLLNHLHFSYTLLNFVSVLYTLVLLCTNTVWQRILRRFSWIKTFGLALLFFIPTEFYMFVMNPQNAWLFLPMCFIQHLMNVGLNFSYSNILYMNLPEENSTAHIAFNTIGCNLFAFLGMMVGTFVSSLTGDNTFPFLGMQMYSVQFTTLLRAFFMTILGFVMVFGWRAFTRDEDVKEIDEQEEIRKKMKAQMKQTPTRWRYHLPRLIKKQEQTK
ncbi:MAG: MFS transporter, partial [Clostridia bacterium]|nr:MFS transporter [Clostridia bacterium]